MEFFRGERSKPPIVILPWGTTESEHRPRLIGRFEYIGLKRGVDKDNPVDPKLRQTAIAQMEGQEAERATMPESSTKDALLAPWTNIGPAPIPNGQVPNGGPTPLSGRVSAIAVHPTLPNIVYVGTPAGGLYRTTDGGSNWTPIMDNSMSMSISAIAIAPSQPDTVYVGTGDAHYGNLSFFGVGLYRIDNASSASPIIAGPLNRRNFGVADVFTGRSISKILVNPANPAIIFVATQSGSGGIGGSAGVATPANPETGVFRSFNATAASPVFQLFGPRNPEGVILGFYTQPEVHDIAVDPLDFNKLVVNAMDTTGIYFSNNALDPFNQFTLPVFTPAQGHYVNPVATFKDVMAEFAVQHTQGQPNATFYAATGNGGGRVLRSTNGGQNWTQQVDNDFCGGQCFYDIAIAVDPTNPAKVYLGGDPTLIFGISTNSGGSFTPSSIGLHVDSHVIAVAPSQPSLIYFGSDGGIYKSADSGSSWIPLNNTQFSATQFMSIATHPTDPNFMIGGTQDNGTTFYRPQGTWTRADFGDGGYSLIDQNATNTTNVRMYHTYFNLRSFQGYGTVSSTASASDDNWDFRGCQTTGATANGITCNGSVNFYAPLEQGPGNPNTVYFGTDRLYRSANAGLDHTVVSQNPIATNPTTGASIPISAIGISPQNDNVRIVGLNNGGIFGTTNGSSPLTNLDPGNVVPNNFVARAVIDPNNANTAYVTLASFGVINVWRTTNLNNATPTWTAAAGGLPQVPVSAFLVDPGVSTTLYAGTDIGVYVSTNSGTSWTPFGTSMPRLPVFDMAITANSNLRAATHGRGIWEMPIAGAPRISINDVSMNEGLTGTTAFNFNVTLSQASTQTVTVGFATADVTATAGSDYIANTGTVTFNPNETSKTLTVLVNGDSTVEPNETFNVNLSNSVSAAIQDNQGVGTIVNDDSGISINDVSLNEGNTGTTAFTFTVNVTPPSPQTVTVNYATANGTAVAPGDYVAVPSTLLVFGAGEASKQITVQVVGDTTVEPNENFTVNLSNPSNSVISDNQGIGTIINDDGGQPGISINDVSMNEGNTGTTAFNFTVSLSAPTSQTVTVSYATASGTAVTPIDFNNVPATTLTFNPNETSKQITVNVNGDTIIEPNETFFVNLTNPTNATITDNQGVGTIVNDDSCTYAINPTSQSFPVGGGNNSVQVTAPAGCAWTAVSNLPGGAEFIDLSIFDLPPRIEPFGEKQNDSPEMTPTATFSGTGVGAIPDGGIGTPPVYGTPLVISFNVSGITGPISTISTDIALTHPYSGDVDMVLRSPSGASSLITVSRIGVTTAGGFGSPADYSGTYAFSDTAAGANIWTAATSSPIPAGTYRTTAGGGAGQSNPPPVTSILTTFSGLSTGQINGAWTLSVRDAAADDIGSVTAANLTITGSSGASFVNITSGASGSGNGTVNYSVGQNTTDNPRTGTMTIAGQTFTINQSNTAASSTRKASDFDGDGKTDISVYRPSNGIWYLERSQAGFFGINFGNSTDRIVPADYDGDGKTDVAVYRPSEGIWYIVNSSNGTNSSFRFGLAADLPAPADYDGDGKADLAVFRPSDGTWYRQNSANGTFFAIQFGANGDKPTIGDFDGDGKADIALYRPSNGAWYQIRSANGAIFAEQFGFATDVIVPADYDGDGKTDLAVYRASEGIWYIKASANSAYLSYRFGLPPDIPAPGDFDGDGKADLSVFRPSEGNWYRQNSANGSFNTFPFGINGDRPTQSAFQ